jgi:hypothetical protein
MTDNNGTETPLTVEALLKILNKPRTMTVAGYDGTCERVIRFNELVEGLELLLQNRDN